MRHVFSMETEREKDLRTLAETIVMCQLKRKRGSCSPSACGECGTYRDLERCMGELPACDTLRVKNMAQELYGLRKFQYGMDKPSFRESIREWKEALWAYVYTSVGALLIAASVLVPALGLLYLLCMR